MSFLDIFFPRDCPFCENRLKSDVCLCEGELPYSDDMYAPLYYVGKVAEAIKRYKFIGKFSYAKTFARLMSEGLSRDDFDFVIAVPSYKDKTEHALVLAEAVAKELKLSCKSGVLVKVKSTEKQHNLNAIERATNLEDVFAVRHNDRVFGKRILLVDDVMTTGATLAECKKMLMKAGVAEVRFLTIATTENLCDN
jgi:Predicted amidophosphoribosyltransferases